MDNVNQWGQFILAAALLSLRRLASLALTRARKLIRTITVLLWNARVKKWKCYSDWNLICFCLREQRWQRALHRSSLRLGFSPVGFICIQGDWEGQPRRFLPFLLSLFYGQNMTCEQGSCRRAVNVQALKSACRLDSAHARAHRDTRCLQLSRHGSS